MTLTVPFAGTDAGRAARPVNEAPQTGNVIAAFGNQLKQVGDRLENDRLDREMGRLQVDMTKDLNDLRLQAESIGDPDQLDSFWQNGIAQLKQSYQTGQTEAGRPRVDPKIRDKWELGFDDLANRHAFAIGQNSLALRQSQRLATFADYEHVAGQQAALTDPGTRDQLYATYDEQVDGLQAKGLLSPEAAAAKKRDFRANTESANITALITEDPQAVLDGIEMGAWPGLDAQAQASWTNKATNAIAAQDKEDERAAEVAAKDQAEKVKGRLTDTIAILGKGRASTDEALLDNPEVAAQFPDLVAQARGAQALRDSGQAIEQMSPPELEALAAQMEKSPVTKKWQTEALDVVHGRLETAKKELDRDPITYAQSVGLPVPPLDLTSADTMAEGLAARATFGGWMREKGYTATAPVLSLDEQSALKAMVDPKGNTPPADRARIAGVLADASPALLASVAPDPAFAHVGGFLAAGGNQALATEVMKGEENIARGTVIMPPEKDRAAPFFASIGGLFDELPAGGGRAREATMKTADALYAARNGLDASGQIDAEAYAQATHEAMGGTGTYGSREATGGIQDINGHVTFMPMGLSARRTDLGLRTLTDALADVPVAGGAAKPRFAAAEGAVRAASESGNLPVINGQYLTADDWGAMQFIAVGNDRYVLARREGGALVRALDAKTGQEFHLSLSRLVSQAERLKGSLAAPRTDPATLGVAP
jgi:hypothetical protein